MLLGKTFLIKRTSYLEILDEALEEHRKMLGTSNVAGNGFFEEIIRQGWLASVIGSSSFTDDTYQGLP